MSEKNELDDLEPIAKGLKQLGFRLTHGTWNGVIDGKPTAIPTLNIDRIDYPEWNGVWDGYNKGEELGRALCLATHAIEKWEKYENTFLEGDAPNP